MAKTSDSHREARLTVPREFYLPETGPAPTEVRRPKDVLPIPSDLYLRESGGRPKRDKKK